MMAGTHVFSSHEIAQETPAPHSAESSFLSAVSIFECPISNDVHVPTSDENSHSESSDGPQTMSVSNSDTADKIQNKNKVDDVTENNIDKKCDTVNKKTSDNNSESLTSEEPLIRKSKRKNWPQKIIKDTNNYECDTCGCIFECLLVYKQHKAKCKENVDFQHQFQNEKFDSETDSDLVALNMLKTCPDKTEVEMELTFDHNDESMEDHKKFLCTHCDKTFSLSADLTSHLKVHNECVKFTCVNCEQVFTSPKAFATHMLENHGEKKAFKCEICGNTYKLYFSFRRHSRVHNKDTALTCEECGKSFAEKITLKRHKTIHTGEKPFNCPVCGFAFRDPSTMRKHIKRHNAEKPYQCETCGKQFVSTYDLRKHSHIHLNDEDRPYKCEVCGKAFYLVAAMKTHLRTHSGEKPHTCDICFASFGDQSNLLAHKKTHSEVKCHQCEICGTTFKWSCNLIRHVRLVHDGQKLFICDVCGKQFGQKVALQVHERMHTGTRPYECPFCQDKFFDKSSLSRHKKEIHKHCKPFSCNICHQKFGRKFVLKRHMSVHGKPMVKSVANKSEAINAESNNDNCVLVQDVSDSKILSLVDEEDDTDDDVGDNDKKL